MIRPAFPLALVFLILPSNTLVAADALPAEWANTPGPSDYPLADVLDIVDTRAFILHADGRVEEHVRHVQKILTYHGLDQAGDPHIPFNSRLQDLRITRSRTFTPDGRILDTQQNGFTVMTPFALEKAPVYTDWKQMVVTHVGLDIGAVVETEYVIEDKVPWRPHLDGMAVLQDNEPALERIVEITVPHGSILHHHLTTLKVEAARREEGDRDIYTWTMNHVPLVDTSRLSEEERSYVPTLLFSTAPDWQDWSNRIGQRVETATRTIPPSLKQKMAGLLKNVRGGTNVAQSLHSFVVDGINTVHWPLPAFAFSPRDASEVFESGYGHALDKAVLLVAMLAENGIDAKIALTGYNPDKDPQIAALPCLSRLLHPILRVNVEDQVLWLDPTNPLSTSSQRNFLRREGLPLIPGQDELHSMTPPDAPSLLDMALEVNIAADFSVKGKGTLVLSGYYSPFFQVNGNDKALEGLLNGIIGALVPGAKTVSRDIVRLEPFRTTFKVGFEGVPPASATLHTLNATHPPNSLLHSAGDLTRSVREFPVLLPSSGKELITIHYTLPAGHQPRHIPQPLQGDMGALSLSKFWTQDQNTLTMQSDISFKADRIDPENYPTFREICVRALSGSINTTFF